MSLAEEEPNTFLLNISFEVLFSLHFPVYIFHQKYRQCFFIHTSQTEESFISYILCQLFSHGFMMVHCTGGIRRFYNDWNTRIYCSLFMFSWFTVLYWVI